MFLIYGKFEESKQLGVSTLKWTLGFAHTVSRQQKCMSLITATNTHACLNLIVSSPMSLYLVIFFNWSVFSFFPFCPVLKFLKFISSLLDCHPMCQTYPCLESCMDITSCCIEWYTVCLHVSSKQFFFKFTKVHKSASICDMMCVLRCFSS